MIWIEQEDGVCLEFDDPVTWVWLLQLMQLVREDPKIPNLLLSDDLDQRAHWNEWVLPELEGWQRECFEVVQRALDLATKQSRHERSVRILFEELDAWTEVLGRARLIMEERWELSLWESLELEKLSLLSQTSAQLSAEMPQGDQLSALQRSQIQMRFHFYGMLEEKMVLKLASLSFPEEEDPLGYEADVQGIQQRDKENGLEENIDEQSDNGGEEKI